jgi:aquaporin Z
MNKYLAECVGTFWLVLGGCGSAVLAAAFPGVGIGLTGVSLAFGLTVVTMAYAIGLVSGCHLNPAVSFGLWAGGRFSGRELAPYVVSQVVGAVLAAGVLYLIASGKPGFVVGGFAFDTRHDIIVARIKTLIDSIPSVKPLSFWLKTTRIPPMV